MKHYQGKHNSPAAPAPKTRKRSSIRKAIVLLSSLLLIFSLAVGGTVAYLAAKEVPVTNIFNPSKVSCQVNETFDGSSKTNVTVKNTGDIEAYIRAAIVVTWKDVENGNVCGSAPISGQDYSMSLNLTDWIAGDDGFYYYKKPVAPLASTAALISRCTALEGRAPEGYSLNVEILSSAIQSVPLTAVNEKWPAVYASELHGDLAKAN